MQTQVKYVNILTGVHVSLRRTYTYEWDIITTYTKGMNKLDSHTPSDTERSVFCSN